MFDSEAAHPYNHTNSAIRDFVKYGYGELVHRFMTHTNVINGQIQYTILDKDSTKSGKDQRQQKSRVMLSNRPFVSEPDIL